MTKNYNCKIIKKYYKKSISGKKMLKEGKDDIRIYELSKFMNDPENMLRFLSLVYSICDYICKDYPNHFNWFWDKQIPRVCKNKGEIIICLYNGKIAGITFLKKEIYEKKICTFYVFKEFRNKHIANKMLEYSFSYLETRKPLITMPEYKVKMFESIIKKNNWELIQIKDKGYYNENYREFVYNGILQE